MTTKDQGGTSANDIAIKPFLPAGRPNDTNNFQPRLGFAYQINPRTVLRGGSGLYYYEPITSDTLWTVGNSLASLIQVDNNGRADFAVNPCNGPLPTFDQAQMRFCHNTGNAPGCLLQALTELVSPEEYSRQLGRNWQNSFGVARQIGDTMSFQADYVYTQGRNEKDIIDNVNLIYNQATGANYPFERREPPRVPGLGHDLAPRAHRQPTTPLGVSFSLRREFSSERAPDWRHSH